VPRSSPIRCAICENAGREGVPAGTVRNKRQAHTQRMAHSNDNGSGKPSTSETADKCPTVKMVTCRFRQRSRHGPCSIARGTGIGPRRGRPDRFGSAAVSERSERAAQGYRRYRCRACGKQFNERSDGVLNRTQYPQRRHRPRGALAVALQACPARSSGDVPPSSGQLYLLARVLTEPMILLRVRPESLSRITELP
jgi:hypothetical protein